MAAINRIGFGADIGQALNLSSISDSLVTGEELDASQRQNTFTAMMKIALETAVRMAELELVHAPWAAMTSRSFSLALIAPAEPMRMMLSTL